MHRTIFVALMLLIIQPMAYSQMRPASYGDSTPNVSFNKNPVKVGMNGTRSSETSAYPAATPATYPHRLIATITPSSIAGSVTFDSSNSGRATVTEVSRTTSGNSVDVVLKVVGVAMTPVSSPNGDAEIRAKLNGNVIKTTKVLVLKPSSIRSPHPEFNGSVQGQNRVGDSSTSPAYLIPAGYVMLSKGSYFTFLTIGVNDQFGNSLHAIYAGAPVTESGSAINQVLTSSGTYSDPVGFTVSDTAVLAEDPPGTPNPTIAQFMASPVPPAPYATIVQNIAVEVEGHSLNPAIVNRRVTTWVPDNLQVEWP